MTDRSVWLRREEERHRSHNDGTLCVAALGRFAHRTDRAQGTFEELFRLHYAVIRRILNSHDEPGLAVIVAGGADIEASAWLRAEDGEINPLIVGRHNAAEIFLPSDPALSLRHLALMLYPRSAGPLRYRLLDLRTGTAFEDEQGRRLEAVESSGPTLVRCASFAVLLFPSGIRDAPWPEDVEDAWQRVPERVYLESASADPERWVVHPAVWQEWGMPDLAEAGSPTTPCVSFPGPVFLQPVLVDASPARGEIALESRWARAALRLGTESLRQGVLLGRYERCDGAGLALLASDRLSRVHLLILEIGGALYAIDTASLNGSFLGTRRIRSTRLEPGRPLNLAGEVSVEWHPFH